MSGFRVEGTKAPIGLARRLAFPARLLAICVALYGTSACGSKPSTDIKPLATGPMAKLEVATKPPPAGGIKAEGPNGAPVALADFRGDVVVVNLWATWCAPCVKEMPTLAALQKAYAGKPVKVMAISLDKGDADIEKAKAFIADKSPLAFYHGDYALAFALTPPAEGLPTTLIFDRSGQERARLSGGADWSTPQAHAVIDRLLQTSG